MEALPKVYFKKLFIPQEKLIKDADSIVEFGLSSPQPFMGALP